MKMEHQQVQEAEICFEKLQWILCVNEEVVYCVTVMQIVNKLYIHFVFNGQPIVSSWSNNVLGYGEYPNWTVPLVYTTLHSEYNVVMAFPS